MVAKFPDPLSKLILFLGKVCSIEDRNINSMIFCSCLPALREDGELNNQRQCDYSNSLEYVIFSAQH